MTENTDILPENSPDRVLAQAHSRMLEGAVSAGEIQDPLYRLLKTSKEEFDRLESSVTITGKDRVWEQLQSEINVTSETNERTGRNARILPFDTGSLWFKAAAAVLLLVVSSLITVMLIRESGPELLASADTSVRVVELTDGSLVTLRPNSSIYEISLSENKQLYRLDGEALFSVSRNTSREFSVLAGRGEVTVLGTRFNLYERDDRTRVDLIEGSVRFANTESSEEVVLEPGQAAEITDALTLSGPFTSNADEITEWTQNRLTFRNRALNDILNELEFHYGIRIDVPSSLENELLGGSVMLDNREQTLRDLGTVLGGSFIETDSGEYEFRVN
ncbi:FecR family protein [Rhodohalobacter mucosus]|uniref:FecR protein domain-containing protein n=1 Tax=Rhodohalobacter mucosus TaxID=2079485 RepID=A0A316TNL8_9BACT|nr:FecR domain-containing protein [Rhodohalobacter mucosus]PWN06203.1 hypothetical protein DDZ15_10230 [Rhodohalobacter mucosus]